jgi:hypothetical protein
MNHFFSKLQRKFQGSSQTESTHLLSFPLLPGGEDWEVLYFSLDQSVTVGNLGLGIRLS